MPYENFIKNITSKDIKLSHSTIENMIKTSDIEAFGLLCEKADFIFPFLKERISKDLVKLVEETDLGVIFDFARYYSSDFEEMIAGVGAVRATLKKYV